MGGKLRLRGSLNAFVCDDETVAVVGDGFWRLLKGKEYASIFPYLNGRHSAEEIVDSLGGRQEQATIKVVIQELADDRLLVGEDSAAPAELAAFWHSWGVGLQHVAKKLSISTVAVRTIGSVPADLLTDALGNLGIRIQEASADFDVVLTDDYLQPELSQINALAMEKETPWLLARPSGARILVGPLFVSRITGCWECLAQRLRINRPLEFAVSGANGSSRPLVHSRNSLPSTLLVSAHLIATEIAKWIVFGRNERLEGKVFELDTTTLSSNDHFLTRQPQCPVCGDMDFRASLKPKPVVLESRPKNQRDGSYRSISPERTVASFSDHISPLTGVVSSLSALPNFGSDLVHNYSSGANLAFSRGDLAFFERNMRSFCGGKGRNENQARASALCEAIERYSGGLQGYEPSRVCRFEELGDAAIHPDELLHFSTSQYEEREIWNKSCPGYLRVLPPFTDRQPIRWTAAWSLTCEKFRFVPTQYCYFSAPQKSEPQFCNPDSNGNAAGNSLEEAILHGFLELVERDAVALWWFNRLKKPVVQLEMAEDDYFGALSDHYRSLSREFWVLDLTGDMEIPVFAAVSRRTDLAREDIVFGFGAHLDARIALERAVTELNQFLPLVYDPATGSRPDFAKNYPELINWLDSSNSERHSYLFGDTSREPLDLRGVSCDATGDFCRDVEVCVQRAKEAGLETLVVDQTRPDIGLPVAKVIVPGLRHMWRRLAPGRLYDVPVKLGWLQQPLGESELNSFTVYF